LKNVGNQTVDVAVEFYSKKEKILWEWLPSTVWLPTFYIYCIYIYLCSTEERKSYRFEKT